MRHGVQSPTKSIRLQGTVDTITPIDVLVHMLAARYSGLLKAIHACNATITAHTEHGQNSLSGMQQITSSSSSQCVLHNKAAVLCIVHVVTSLYSTLHGVLSTATAELAA
jgi:hypothetical protein